MKARLVIAAPIALGVLLSAGCGGHSTNNGIASVSGDKKQETASPSPSASADRMQAALDFARCMRAHGVDMPDPDPNGGVKIQVPGGTDKTKVSAAQQACKQYLPNGGVPPTLSPEQVEQARTFAKCMREHGVNVPDPDPATGRFTLSGVNPDDPAFKNATQACKSAYSGPLMFGTNGGAKG